jgi:hypothetical protein
MPECVRATCVLPAYASRGELFGRRPGAHLVVLGSYSQANKKLFLFIAARSDLNDEGALLLCLGVVLICSPSSRLTVC